jgi:hypothetical protein
MNSVFLANKNGVIKSEISSVIFDCCHLNQTQTLPVLQAWPRPRSQVFADLYKNLSKTAPLCSALNAKLQSLYLSVEYSCIDFHVMSALHCVKAS